MYGELFLMAFKIGSKTIFEDSAYTGFDMGGHSAYAEHPTETYTLEWSGSGIPLIGGGRNFNLNRTGTIVEMNPPSNAYSSGGSNVIHDFITDQGDANASNTSPIQHFYLKIVGARNVKGMCESVKGPGYAGIPEHNYGPSTSNTNDLSCMEWDKYGRYFYAAHKGDRKVYQWYTTASWGVSTLSSYSPDYLDIDGIIPDSDDMNRMSIRMSWDGNKFYIKNSGNVSTNSIYQFSLSTPYEIDTATLDSTYTITGTSNDVFQNDNALEFKNTGTRLLMFGNDYTKVFKLNTPWDLSSIDSSNEYGTGWKDSAKDWGHGRDGAFSSENGTRLDPDNRYVRVFETGQYYQGYHNYRWREPWVLKNSLDSTFDKEKNSLDFAQSVKDFKLRPGGMHLTSLLPTNGGDRLYKYNTEDSAGATEPRPLTFGDFVQFQDGYCPEFPDSGENLWLEFMSFDSGQTYYAKKIYKG